MPAYQQPSHATDKRSARVQWPSRMASREQQTSRVASALLASNFSGWAIPVEKAEASPCVLLRGGWQGRAMSVRLGRRDDQAWEADWSGGQLLPSGGSRGSEGRPGDLCILLRSPGHHRNPLFRPRLTLCNVLGPGVSWVARAPSELTGHSRNVRGKRAGPRERGAVGLALRPSRPRTAVVRRPPTLRRARRQTCRSPTRAVVGLLAATQMLFRGVLRPGVTRATVIQTCGSSASVHS
jgi:hypothetical protein